MKNRLRSILLRFFSEFTLEGRAQAPILLHSNIVFGKASNISNATLGSLFLTEEAEFTSFNPINET
jgi:hypothetical protein